ncbi:MAG: trypsin-like serine protease [Candidatus Eisenbacteria bacterium]|uniref:Trypsin-like serine protease n=1 Tax=Eiseniibacteriota bacterium TaxID=2212470 RepID=A0A538UD48_UNCEI|nr:MAG: trypsin-like serine protease [Candidatus Eisenbacteria bacterium]
MTGGGMGEAGRAGARRDLRATLGRLVAVAGGAVALALAGRAEAAPAQNLMSSRRTAIVTAAERVSPSVVSVSVIATRVVRADPFPGMPHDDFFDRFFPPSEFRQRTPGLGSGVIVDASGLVLTNEHVTHDAEEIKVTLTDGREFPAKVMGASEVYDLAVLKVEGSDLPAAPLADSDRLMVGEWAIAIGNPFGYLLNDTQPTVTAGVISATHRDIKVDASGTGVYKNMIQTDAAINPGNSGGPLVNADGEVIGINAFIFTQSGGSIGLGFAIPINLAKRVMQEIRSYGRVRQPYPGMNLQPLTRELAARLGFADLSGLVVSRVDPDGPAGRAGVKPGDRIRKVNGIVVNNVDDAQRGIYGANVGDKLVLGIERGSKSFEVTLVLVELPGGGR